ncbi:HNH endonuclease signature motif containing protein, partial [Paramicrobacterium chengjingii]|uniref:HNH endonuclease signature motif containing protein n=1 Tax=Paramicrobacterium chengjingii TaxID=2769067 RepID=UPI0014211F8C
GKQKSAPKLHGRGPTVLVTVKNDDLENGAGAAWSPGTPAPLPMSFVKQMRCDGDTRQVRIDEHGDVLNLGYAKREFTPKQRLALIARDGGTCVAADCDIPAWLCEAHHVQGWAKDGKTDTTNGVMLCWFHHRLVERGEWALTRDNTGQPRLIPPDWYVNRRYLGRRRKTGDDNDTGPDPGRDTRPRT